MSLVWLPCELPEGCTVKKLDHSQGDEELSSGKFLPIERDELRIKHQIRRNSVVAIKAETGSGKTMKGPQYLREEVSDWPVPIVQKSCLAADLVVQSLVEAFNIPRDRLHLRTGIHDTDTFHDLSTGYSVITYGILWEWLPT